MSYYKRFLSYIYAYDGASKLNGMGFAKMEIRDERYRLSVNLNAALPMDAKGYRAGIYSVDEKGIRLALIGSPELKNGSFVLRSMGDAAGFCRGRISLNKASGLVICSEAGKRLYLTSWSDTDVPITDLRECIHKLKDGFSEITFAGKEDAAEASVAEKTTAKEDEAARSVTGKAESAPENTDDNSSIIFLDSDEVSMIGQSVSEELQSNAAGQGISREPQSSAAGQGISREPQSSAAGQGISREPQSSAAGQGISREPQSSAAGQGISREPQSSAAEEYIFEGQQAKVCNADSAANQDSTDSTANQDNADATANQEDEETFSEQESNNLNGAGIPDIEGEIKEKQLKAAGMGELWHEFKRMYPKLRPFADESWEVLQIKVQDIGRLSRENWILGNNNFVLHGFYRYGYLILARKHKQNMDIYILGVPGVFTINDRFMATMFGMTDFMEADNKRPDLPKNFGYWCTRIDM